MRTRPFVPPVHARGRARVATALSIVAAIACLLAPRIAAAFERVVLANGLVVLLADDPAASGASVAVRYAVGARDEPQGLNGLAHLVEHLAFDGTRHLRRGQGRRLLDAAGAWDVNAETTHDATTFHETVPPGALDLALWIESERMAYPLEGIDESTAAREASVVVHELEGHLDRALGTSDRWVQGALFPSWHPYHQRVAGTFDGLPALRLADARAFARTWYVPRAATLAIVGRFDPARALASVRRYFEPIADRAPPQRPRLDPLDGPDRDRLCIVGSGLRPQAWLMWITPPLGTRDDAALDFLAETLQRRFARTLVEPGAALAATARQRSLEYASVFEVSLLGARRASPSSLVGALDAAMRDVQIDAPRIERARMAWETAWAAQIDDGARLAAWLTAHPASRGAPSIADDPHASVTVEDVRRVWSALRASPRLEVRIRSDPRFPRGGVEVPWEACEWEP